MKRIIIVFSLLIFSLCFLKGEDFNDYYSSWSSMFGIDPNAGTNSFLILLIPSGGKFEGMATAYTAIAIDSGFIDSNPAASSLLNNSELAFLHNNWINDANLESIIFATRINNIGFGFGAKIIYLPFSGVDDWGDRYSNSYTSQFATGYYWETVGTANFSYNFLKSYYFDGISIGANLKVAYRNIPYNIAANQSAIALMGDIGVMTRFNFLKPFYSREKNFSLGVSLKNMGGEIISNPDPLPTMFSAGLAYRPFRPLIIAFDFNLPFNLDGTAAQNPYFATGIDLTLTDFLSIQTGILIKSGLPRFVVGAALELEKVDFVVNYTLDLTTQFDKLDRISLEVRFDIGDYGRKEIEDKAEKLYIEGLKLYAEGDFVNAIRKWKECLELNPIFTPAEEMIETALTSFQLQEEMLEKQIEE